MGRIESLYAAIGDNGGWDAYVAGILGEHRRKTNLMARIADRGWSWR
jgi:hypothetical protein